MNRWEDYYKILQVDPEAEPEIIESAYKRLCKKYHPDLNRSWQAEERIRTINRAYEILHSPDDRRQYHRQWLRAGRNRNPQPAVGGAAVNGRDMEAQKTLRDYFIALSQNDYPRAYGLLANRDQAAIPLREFVAWQSAVSRVYAIGSFRIRLFKKFSPLQGSRIFGCEALEYVIETTEKNLKTGQVMDNQVTKTVVWQKDGWRIFLGYDDLQPLIQKFLYLAEAGNSQSMMAHWQSVQEKTDQLSGLPNRLGFMQQAAKEVYRCRRYGTEFSLAAWIIELAEDQPAHAQAMQESALLLTANIRETDFAASLGGGCFVALLSQTGRSGAKEVARKIARLLAENLAAIGFLRAAVSPGVVQYRGQEIHQLMEICLTRAGRHQGLQGSFRRREIKK